MNRVAQQQSDAVREGFNITIRDAVAIDPILNKVGQSSDARSHDRRAAGHRFEGNHPKRFVMGGHDQQFGGGIIIGQDILAAFAEEKDGVTVPQFAAQTFEARHFGCHFFLGRIRVATNNRQIVRHLAGYPAIAHEGDGAHEVFNPFQGFNAADKEDHLFIGRHADKGPGLIDRDRVKMTDIHARRDDGDFIRVGAIQGFELHFFGTGGCHQTVSPGNHFLLAIQAVSAFDFRRRAGHAVFHQHEGMEHLHNGHVPGLLQGQGGDT